MPTSNLSRLALGSCSGSWLAVAMAAVLTPCCSDPGMTAVTPPVATTAHLDVLRPLPQHVAVGARPTSLSVDFVREDGRVVMGVSGAVTSNADGIEELYRWESGVGMRGLGYPQGVDPATSDGIDLRLLAFSRDGAVAAAEVFLGTASGVDPIAWRWHDGEAMAVLPFDRTNAVSADGGVLVGYAGNQAVRWTAEAGTQPLPSRPDDVVLRSVAAHVSQDGQLIVGQVTRAELSFFWWTPDAGMLVLEPPQTVLCPTDTVFAADGRTIAARCSPLLDPEHPDTSPPVEIVRWRFPSVTRQSLGVPDGFRTALDAILSADGSRLFSVFAVGDLDREPTAVFRWSEASGWIAVPKLSDFVRCATHARAVSQDGGVIAGVCDDGQGSQSRVFKWSDSTGTRALDPPAGLSNAVVANLSASGRTAAGWASASGTSYAVIWDDQLGARRVDDLLVERGADLQGIRLSRAEVSGDGSTLVGQGDAGGDPVVWVARLRD